MSRTSPEPGKESSATFMEERRRSRRVVIRIPVYLKYTVDEKKVEFEASTVSVNDHGAMLLSTRTLAAGTVLEMQNARTRERLDCRVTRKPVGGSEGYLIPVEFLQPGADFWRISFPPSNWKPSED